MLPRRPPTITTSAPCSTGSPPTPTSPPSGSAASFDPLVLAEGDRRILGSNYGSSVPHRDIPDLVDRYMSGDLDLDAMVSSRRPLEEASMALDDLAQGSALRQLLLPNPDLL